MRVINLTEKSPRTTRSRRGFYEAVAPLKQVRNTGYDIKPVTVTTTNEYGPYATTIDLPDKCWIDIVVGGGTNFIEVIVSYNNNNDDTVEFTSSDKVVSYDDVESTIKTTNALANKLSRVTGYDDFVKICKSARLSPGWDSFKRNR